MAMADHIQSDKVASVYVGKADRCCCGCAGKHTFGTRHRGWAQRNRGYQITDDEVSDRTLKTVVTKMNRFMDSGTKVDREATYVAITVGTRIYIAYWHTDESGRPVP